MRAQRIATRDSARRAADSITRIRLAAQNPPAPPALSHDDSIAIAEKVNKRVRASRLRDSVARAKLQDSLQRVEEKKARDSIFKAYDRWDHHMYEFQFGKRPFDPDGPKYRVSSPQQSKKGDGNACTTTLDNLDLNPGRVFGYWFDFGDDWYHQVRVDRIEKAIPTVTYPRVIRRVGKSPPQYRDE